VRLNRAGACGPSETNQHHHQVPQEFVNDKTSSIYCVRSLEQH